MKENDQMKIKILLIGAATLLVLLASAWAADVTGKWVAETQGMQGPSQTTFVFKVDGTTLTGTVTTSRGDSEISEGKVSGDEISFAIVRKRQDGGESKTIWKGKVSGDEIKFTREFQGGMMGGPGGPGAGGPPGGGQGGPGAGGPGPGGPGGGFGGPPPEIIAKRVK
jgi:hypothetical protein